MDSVQHVNSLNSSNYLTATNLLSPPIVIDQVQQFYVVRDDLLPGGSKQRACGPLLENYFDSGFSFFYYASPFAGFAQVALAYTCQQMKLNCHIFCEMDPTQSYEGAMHEFTLLAKSYGAKITMVKTLAEGELGAQLASQAHQGSVKIPLGFDCDEFKDAFEVEIRCEWNRLKRHLKLTPKRLWLPVGSGTLASVFQKVLKSETELNCVNVRVLPSSDERIQRLVQNSCLKMYTTPESFHQKVSLEPQVPSNAHYDAKVWQFLKRFGQKGDVWWNVAR